MFGGNGMDYAKMAKEQIDDANERVKLGTKAAKMAAAEHYHKAAEYFRLADNNLDAGKAYEEAAGQHIDNDNDYQAATLFSEGGEMYLRAKPADTAAAIIAFHRSVDIFTEKDCFDYGASRCYSLAKIYEGLKQTDKASEFYQKGSNYYVKGSAPRHAFACRQQVARVSAEEGNYDKAIEIYEHTAKAYENNEGLKQHAKGCYMRATICHLCKDKTKAAAALAKYVKACPELEATKEYGFCQNLLTACDKNNVSALVKDYQFAPYLNDSAVQGLLLKIKS